MHVRHESNAFRGILFARVTHGVHTVCQIINNLLRRSLGGKVASGVHGKHVVTAVLRLQTRNREQGLIVICSHKVH
jgi:hypothetical protein